MTHLYLIRHADHQGTVDGIIGDYGLTPKGVTQAEHLRDRLAAGEIKADVLIASTLARARQTAEIIAPALGLPIIWDDEVQEIRPGAVEGMHMDEFRKKYGMTLQQLEQEPFRPIGPGGESRPQFLLRVGTALDRITRQHEGKTIVVVCHGGVVDGSFFYFFGLGTMMAAEAFLYTRNTSITHWYRETLEGITRWRLVKYNDDQHLRDIGATARIPWKELLSTKK